jgi:hypothetical protein
VIKNGYASCIKSDWWKFWQGTTPQDCITVSASNDPGYRPNYCFEKDWDSADTVEAIDLIAETAVGVTLAALAAPESGGTLSYPAYCMGSIAVSAAGGWILSSVHANDKWPHGIDQ